MDFGFRKNIYVIASFLFPIIIIGLIFISPVLFTPLEKKSLMGFVKTTKADSVQTSVIVTITTPTPTPISTPAPPLPAGGGGAVFILPPQPTKVILQGKAYPGSIVTILQDGKVITSLPADLQANFKVEISDITPGVWSFTLWAEDKAGRKSISFSFTTSVTQGVTTMVSGIFLPPTIELGKTELAKGEVLNILGMTAPKSEVSIFISSPQEIIKKTKAEPDGTYFYPFDTTPVEEGSHTVRSKATSPEGLLSTFSQSLAFGIGKRAEERIRADINGDGKVNLVDFSILLYNWGAPKNPDADLNEDGKVNLTDFSIMMYWWTG